MSATPAKLGIQNIGQVSIIVHDLPRATAFYRDVLGLPLLFTAPNLAFFDCGGVRLMLGPAETPQFDHPSSILYFRVPDLNAAYQRLVELGAKIFAPPRRFGAPPENRRRASHASGGYRQGDENSAGGAQAAGRIAG